MKHVCFYLSNHGFGHMARTIPIIRELLKYNEVDITLVCGKKQLEFAQGNLTEFETNISYREKNTDIGLILQPGTLLVDKKNLEKACKKFLDEIPDVAKKESKWLIDNQIDIVFCDMPIWAIYACELANVALIYYGNFTWAEIYREFLPVSIWNNYAKWYKKIKNAYLYELHNQEMLEFINYQGKASLTARNFDLKKVKEIKDKHQRPIVFAALGMSASFDKKVDVSKLSYDFYTTEGVPLIGNNVISLAKETFNTHDYIYAADYIITKAGWGTIAECLLAKKPMALFARDTVLEDRSTIDQLVKGGYAIKIEQSDLDHIDNVIEKLKLLTNANYDRFYDCSKEIADNIMLLANKTKDRKC